ncbi:MAG: hypothetical protein AB1757_06810 [Acidobacteriota bacterium]
MKVFNRGVKVNGPLFADTIITSGGMGSGHIYWVKNPSASDYQAFYDEHFAVYENAKPNVFATISDAIANCVANAGDIILVAPDYTETRTAAITVNVAGVSIIGLGSGTKRPTITGNGTIDVFNVTAAGVTIENIRFAAPETDDQTADINVAAAGCTIRNTYHIGSQTSKNKTDIITVASGGDDLLVEDVVAYNTVVDCVSWLSLEAAVARPVIRNCVIQGQFSTGVLMDEATATLATIRNNIFKNTKAATAVVTFTTGNSTGVMSQNFCSGRHTTIASNIVAGTGMDFHENYVVEEAALNGILVPAADAD